MKMLRETGDLCLLSGCCYADAEERTAPTCSRPDVAGRGHQPRARRSLWAMLAAAALVSPLAVASDPQQDIQDLETVRQAVESFVAAQTPDAPGTRTITVDNLDSRLRLQACAEPIQTFFPPGARTGVNRTVGASCTSPKPWTIYVSVHISYRGNVVVAAHSLSRGAVIGASDIMIQARNLQSEPFGYLTQGEQVVGMRTLRPIRAGAPIARSLVEEVPVVTRGQKVWLIAESPHLQVRMTGTALQDGAVGDRVRVQNRSSRKIVEGIVAQDGAIRISL
jgi:flagella basal body P-ring formation protein FlgA